MKNLFTLKYLLLIIVFNFNNFQSEGQAVMANYDFNSAAGYPLNQSILSGITCSITSTEPFNSPTGTATGINAFITNSNGNSISMNNSSGTNTRYFQIQLGGASLSNYSGYKIYFQAQRSGTGATTITLAYSTNGTVYTNFPTTQAPGNGSFSEVQFDLSSISSINNQSNVYFRILVSGATSSSGTFRIDNFQIERSPQYFRTISSGDWNLPATWESSLDNVTFSSQGLTPSANDKTIIIQAPHTVTVSSSVSLDETSIDGILQVSAGGILNVFDGAGNDVTVGTSGILDAGSTAIVNNSALVSFLINGKLKTAYANGFTGSATTLIPSGTVTLNSGSSIEYNAAGNQSVTARPDYSNVIFSGSGIKTPSSAFTPTGTLTITGSAILNASNNNVGDGVAGKTNFTMDGGRLILGTTGTQPMMDGTYNLTGGIVEFANTNATTQTIRNKSYQNIEITGNNVGNSNGNITLNTNGTFTIKTNGIFQIKDNNIVGVGVGGTQSVIVENNGTFRCGNNEGFNGFTATLTNNSSVSANITNINLNTGSTIEYIGNSSGTQAITNANSLIYSNVILSGTGNETAPADILTIIGNFTKTGTCTFLHNNGTVLFDGGSTAQSYSSNSSSNSEVLFNNLTNNNLNTVTGLSINSDLAIAGQLTLNANSKLNLATGNITLKSTSAATANVASIPSTASISYGTGAFTVERYMQAVRAWRFLAIPTQPNQFIHDAWQEGESAGTTVLVGKGTEISSDLANPTTLGFDFASATGGGPSMKWYDPITKKYTGIPTTNTAFDPSLGGYMTFVRGDRTINGYSPTATETTLRTKGALFTGDHSPAIIPLNQSTPVNNPFASRIDLSKIDALHQFTFYIWDPTLGGTPYGVGAIRTISWDGSAYTIAPVGGYTGSIGIIESGQAFFARGFSNGNLLMDESVKTGGSALVSTPAGATHVQPKLQTNLYAIEDGNAVLKDGILNTFDDAYSNTIDGADAIKFTNFNENLAISRESKLLAIERRHTVVQNDTIFLHFSGTRQPKYRFEFVATGLGDNGINGFVEDNYLHTKTPLNITGTTLLDFTVNSGDTSSASNRFRIVLNVPEAGPLPVTVTNVKAYPKNESVAVEWNVENETGIRQYDIEKSVDGIRFQKETAIAAKNTLVSTYQWLDGRAVKGYNYYRIRILNADGKTSYTAVVKAFIEKVNQAFTIYPNPIVGGVIKLQLINQPAGEYNIRLINKMGQVLVSKQINHIAGSSMEAIKAGHRLNHGVYQLAVTGPGGDKTNLNVIY